MLRGEEEGSLTSHQVSSSLSLFSSCYYHIISCHIISCLILPYLILSYLILFLHMFYFFPRHFSHILSSTHYYFDIIYAENGSRKSGIIDLTRRISSSSLRSKYFPSKSNDAIPPRGTLLKLFHSQGPSGNSLSNSNSIFSSK